MRCTEEKHTVLITRVFAVSVFGLALATGALAQTTPTTPTLLRAEWNVQEC